MACTRYELHTAKFCSDGGGGPSEVTVVNPDPIDVNIADGVTLDVEFTTDYAEDSVHANADVGTFVLAVRNDAQSVLTSDDGDYSPIAVDGRGNVVVNFAPEFTTVDDQLRVSVGSEYAEDAPHTTGDFGSFVLGVRNDSDAVLTDTDGDYSPLSLDSSGRLKVILSDSQAPFINVASAAPGIPGTVVPDSRWHVTTTGDITLGAVSAVSPAPGADRIIVVDWWNFNVGAAVGIGGGLLTPTVEIQETTSGTPLWQQSSIVGTTLSNAYGSEMGPPILLGAENDTVTFVHPQATIALLTIGVAINFGGYIIDVS